MPKLRPERDVAPRDGRFVAAGAEPWLAVDGLDLGRLAGRMIEITYRLSLWDEPARPVFRFWQGETDYVDAIAPGPVEGAGVWIGRMPGGTTRLSVSPTNRLGPFDFGIERLRARFWPKLIWEGLRRNPRATRSTLLTRVIGWTPESDVNLSWALGRLPLSHYPAWARRRRRAADLAGLDRPRFDWAQSPPVQIIVAGGDAADIRQSVDSLRAQILPYWTATVCGAFTDVEDPRIARASPAGVRETARAQPDGTITCVLAAGDRLTPPALAHLIEQAQRNPAWRIAYGDALLHQGNGHATPVFRPGWSPCLHASRGLAGPIFVKDLRSFPTEARRHFLERGDLPAAALADLSTREVMPLRRILLETRHAPPPAGRPKAPEPSRASAVIIIPTRDHPALLRRVVASIRTHSPVGRYGIVIVDNGSETDDAKALLAELEHAPDVLRLDQPGPFNFSAICNTAAATAPSDVLIFLNDDTEVLTDGWLDRLIAHAMDPGVGAVGARLTYPDGRIQHIGVVIGMGGGAGHFGALDVGGAPGWQARNHVAHEVSAVTGACLAVAREKFEAVGGFDAEHLPIELSDVDLCLKLNARGWQTMVDPAVHLMHEESVSRGGATLRRLDVYGAQRAIFVERWRHVMRDDPFFHPALSLYSWHAALG